MDNIEDKNKKFVFLSELLGSSLLVFGINMNPQCLPAILLAISIWSWEIGVAHFNYAITIGSMVFNFVKNKPFLSNLKQTIILISAQTLGAFFGIFLSYLATYKLQSDIQAPKSMALCPAYI